MFQKNRNSEEQTLILKNLDVMAYTDRANFKAQEPPSLSKAQIELQPILVRDLHGQKFSLACSLQQFRKYGPGVYLVFKFMKYFLVVMGLLLPFPLANMIILIKSENQYNDTNLETILESTTLNGESQQHTLFSIFNFLVILFLTIFMVYWKKIEPKLVVQCSDQICLPSYFTVILKDIPNHYTQQDFKQYIQEKYGKIYDIYTAKNYHQDLKKYRLLHEIIEQFKQERQFYIKNKANQSCIKLIELFLKYRKLHQHLNESASNQTIYEPYCAFITFQNSMQRVKLLSDQQSETSLFSCLKNKGSQQQNGQNIKKIKFQPCQMEPDGVAWQNLNMSSQEAAWRCALITFLLLIFLFLAITIIFIFVAAQSGLYLDQQNGQSIEEMIRLNETESLKGYCLDLSYNKFHSKPECNQFNSEYNHYYILFLAFPVVITLLKMMFAYIMKEMVKIRRHKNSFQKVQWQIIILSLFYFIKAALIKFVIYRKFVFGSVTIELLQVYLPLLMQLKQILPIYPERIHTFNSFSGEWVAHTSHKIILIGIFSFNFTIMFHFIHGLIVKKCREYKAGKMVTQHRINQLLKGAQFQIEVVYAEVISLVLFCMMYFSCMPIIYLLTFFSLFLLYWTSKYSLINFCRRPIVFSHGISILAVKLMFYGLILSCIVSPIYSSELQTEEPHSLLYELIEHWEYFTLLILILVYLVGGQRLKKLISTFYTKIRTYFDPRYKNESFRNVMKELSHGKGRMQSYSMHENEKYNEILQILFIINKIEINKIGYFNHSRISVLKAELNKKDHQYKLFQELLEYLQQELSHMSKDRNRQKLEDYLNLLKLIQQQAAKQTADEQKQRDMRNFIKDRIKQSSNYHNILKDTLDIDNILKLKSQIKSQLSYDMNLEPAPETQKRLH